MRDASPPVPAPLAALRLPDGRRLQRRFPGSALVAALYDFCLSQSDEAAAGRPFTLAQPFPGAPCLQRCCPARLVVRPPDKLLP